MFKNLIKSHKFTANIMKLAVESYHFLNLYLRTHKKLQLNNTINCT